MNSKITRTVLGIILILFLCASNKHVYSKQLIHIKPLKTLENTTYRIEQFFITDVNGGNDEELILVETPDSYPLMPLMTINKLTEQGRELLWKSSKLYFANKMLIGDIDGNKFNDILFYGTRPLNYTQQEKTLRLVKWNGEKIESKEFTLSGRVGILADLNNDDKDELILGEVQWLDGEGEGLDPINLKVYSWNDNSFDLIKEIPFTLAVSKILAVDLDGDGIDEIITEENEHSGNIRAQISVYKVGRDMGLNKLFSVNNLPATYNLQGERITALTAVKGVNRNYIKVDCESEDSRSSNLFSISGNGKTEYGLQLKDKVNKLIKIDMLKSEMVTYGKSGKFVKKTGTTLEVLTQKDIEKLLDTKN